MSTVSGNVGRESRLKLRTFGPVEFSEPVSEMSLESFCSSSAREIKPPLEVRRSADNTSDRLVTKINYYVRLIQLNAVQKRTAAKHKTAHLLSGGLWLIYCRPTRRQAGCRACERRRALNACRVAFCHTVCSLWFLYTTERTTRRLGVWLT